MTMMVIKRHTKRHTKRCMVLENLHTLPTTMKYHIKPLTTTYTDSDAMSVDSLPMFNAAKASSARDQCPA
jgi:hypothetical protein